MCGGTVGGTVTGLLIPHPLLKALLTSLSEISQNDNLRYLSPEGTKPPSSPRSAYRLQGSHESPELRTTLDQLSLIFFFRLIFESQLMAAYISGFVIFFFFLVSPSF